MYARICFLIEEISKWLEKWKLYVTHVCVVIIVDGAVLIFISGAPFSFFRIMPPNCWLSSNQSINQSVYWLMNQPSSPFFFLISRREYQSYTPILFLHNYFHSFNYWSNYLHLFTCHLVFPQLYVPWEWGS